MNRDFTEKEFKEIQTESHQFHKTYQEVMGSYEEKENKLDEQSLGLFNVLLTSIGVIAGFGFTALNNVVNHSFFFIGEFLLLSLIVIGLYTLFTYNKSKVGEYQKMGEQWHSLLNPRLLLYKDFLTLKITKKELFKKLNEDDKKVLNFQPVSPKHFGLDKYFLRALVLLTIGSIFLLGSFIDFHPKRKGPNWQNFHRPYSHEENYQHPYVPLRH